MYNKMRDYSAIPMTEADMVRFLSKIQYAGPDDCWEFRSANTGKGYRQFRINGISYLAHRLSYVFFVGDIPPKKLIRHKCHNRGCVNPKHLRPGTHHENQQDMMEAGRHVSSPGEKNGMARLTEDQIHHIRVLYATGIYRQEDLAAMYSVSRPAISMQANGKTWASTEAIDKGEKKNYRYVFARGESNPAKVNPSRGEKNGNSTLTWEIVRAIRKERKEKKIKQKVLADRYNVSVSTVQSILYNKTWQE